MNFSDLKKNLIKDYSNLPTVRVALLGDTATQFLAIALRGMGYERGYNMNLYEAGYDDIERQIFVPTSELYQFNADVVIVFQSAHKLLSYYNNLSVDNQASLASERIHFIETIYKTLNTKIIYFNYPEIDDTVFGSFANRVESSFLYQIRKLNYELMTLEQRLPNLYLSDLSSIQNKIGRGAIFEPFFYVNSEMVLSTESLPEISARTMDIICALKGKFRKCLIFDLDNTIWGGIIGDDGLDNIQIGHGLGKGKSFTEFQQWIKKLKNRGIILAVCSKNTESVAKEPFEKHPEMVLRLDDIAVFIANWENKPDNIRSIQQILNINFDSMVFLDDNPFERNMVRQSIPEITVPELPEDPAEYLEYLYSLNLFETVSFSQADADRTLQYKDEANRALTQRNFTNETDFLKSLNMTSEAKPFSTFNIPRVAQLSQRSNQFNLRTIRFTEGDLERMSLDNYYECFSFSLEDKFGDSGLICVVILEKMSSETLFINTWFMSCRVLRRGMEDLALNVIAKYAVDNGYKTIIGEYIATSKNGIVACHYINLGFIPVEDDLRKLYKMDVDSYKERECYISIKNN